MPDHVEEEVSNWLEKQTELPTALKSAFIEHAIDNRGILTSTRRADDVVTSLIAALTSFTSEATIVGEAATKFADQGMAMVTGQALMRVLGETAVATPTILPTINHFQLTFLQNLANARELNQHRVQERSQMALQRALHTQLEQQILLHDGAKQRNEHLNQILQLNTRLNQLGDEESLLKEAVHGVCRSLSLTTVSIYEYNRLNDGQWLEKESTASNFTPSREIEAATLTQLNTLLRQRHEITRIYQNDDGDEGVSVLMLLRAGRQDLGALAVKNDHLGNYSHDSLLILLRTFAQNLASLWHNIYLITDSQERAKELEILHGRYIDTMWRAEESTLIANYQNQHLSIDRNPQKNSYTQRGFQVPLQIGDELIGELHFADKKQLSRDENAFVTALVHEMSSALNNARFLQTAHANSNQLSVAAEVSRAATTILDLEQLIQEVAELIRNRFNYYYVGLFLVNEVQDTAVLRAGTGKEGEQQRARNHQHPIDGSSMVGNAIATGTPHIEQDVTQAAHFNPNKSLPDTKAEIALPLRIHNRIIGALTVQSRERGAFPADTVTVLQNLADQLAVAIENATLFARTEENLQETQRLYQTVSQMTEAQTEVEVFKCLLSFAAESGLVDLATIITVDPSDPEYITMPLLWHRIPFNHDPDHKYLRDKYIFTDQLENNSFIQIENGQTDPQIDEATRRMFVNNDFCTDALLRISSKNKWFGSLSLIRQKPKLFTAEELQPFFTLVDQAAVILSNMELLKQTEALYSIGRQLNQIIARDDALEITVKEIARYTGAPQCRFVLYNPLAHSGIITAVAHPTEHKKHFLPMENDFVYEYFSQNKHPLILDPADDTIPKEAIATHVTAFDSKSSLLIPAASQHELIGYLAIDSHRGQRPFSQNNIIFTRTVVDLLTTQLENIKLFDEALQRAQELITLNQIQSTITQVLNISDLAKSIYSQIGQLVDSTVFTMAKFDPAAKEYIPILCMEEAQQVEVNALTLAETHPIHHIFQEDTHIIVDHSHPILHHDQGCAINKERVQSGLWMPFHKEGKVDGLISVQSFWANAYNENDIQLLRSITTQVSLAISNVDLFEKIQAQNEELVQLDELKNQFLANMSHELRTPLNSIIGFSRVILKGIDGPITTEQEEDLSSIYHNGQHLLTLINEILDMAKIDAGKMALTFETTDILPITQGVYKTVEGLIQPDKINLVWDVDEELPTVEADPLRIRQILLNLLSNAAKYTEEGEVTLKVYKEEHHIHIQVSDTGIGIAPEDYDKVFAAFEQVDSSTTRTVGGTGLGLPITKWLIEMHHGQIYFESELDKGTTFHVLLPTTQIVHASDSDVLEGVVS